MLAHLPRLQLLQADSSGLGDASLQALCYGWKLRTWAASSGTTLSSRMHWMFQLTVLPIAITIRTMHTDELLLLVKLNYGLVLGHCIAVHALMQGH